MGVSRPATTMSIKSATGRNPVNRRWIFDGIYRRLWLVEHTIHISFIIIIFKKILSNLIIHSNHFSIPHCITPPPRRRRWSRMLIIHPVVLVLRRRMDQLRGNLHIRFYRQHCPRVLMPPAVIRRREHCDQLPTRKPLEPIHHAFVSPDNQTEVILLQEPFHNIGPELHDLPQSVRVSGWVGMHPDNFIVLGGVRPQDVEHKLLFLGFGLVDDCDWTLDAVNLLNVSQRGADAAMQAQDLILDHCCQGHSLEHPVDPPEDRVLVVPVLLAFELTLVREPEPLVGLDVLVVAADQMNLLGVHAFEGEQEADCL